MTLKNGVPLHIEPADPRDAKQILAYLALVGGESDNLLFGREGLSLTPEAEEAFIRNLAQAKTSAMLVGKISGEIVCVGSVTSPPKARIAHQGDLGLTVKKSFWGIGVGTALMNALIDFARKNGQTEVLHLGVKADNLPALQLYKKMGFTEIGRYKNFFKIDGRYYDEIMMNLYL